jgi:CRP/FNR family transcriptional regulator/CRP/FNR family cyclic AMP-dependent transcriptional regulator
MAEVHFLHNVSLFASLSTSELEPLSQRLISRRYRAGEGVFEQGSPGNSLYIVKSGLVDIIVAEASGHSRALAQIGPGQVFGEFALLDGLPRSAGAVAHERSELLILTRPEFFMYLEQHRAVAINLLVLLSRRLRFAVQQTGQDETQVPALVRLAHLLADFGDRYGDPVEGGVQLSLRLTRGEMAGMMGCPRSEAEAAIETLQDRGLIEMHGLQMTIHDLEALRAIAAES